MPVKKSVGKAAKKKAVPTPAKEKPPIATQPANNQQEEEQEYLVGKKHTPFTSLNDKQLYFCKRYVLNGNNACKAARESGYNEWYSNGRLLKEPLIIAEIERWRAKRKAKFEVNADRVIQELVKVAFGTLGDFVQVAKDGTPIIDCDEVGQEEMAALSEITQDMYVEKNGEDFDRVKKTKIKMHSKVAALEQLGRIFKLFGEGGDMDKDTPEQKALKIRAALRAMNEADGTP